MIKAIPYLVYQANSNVLQRLKARIMDSVVTVTYKFQNTRTDVEYSLDICLVTTGVHIEIPKAVFVARKKIDSFLL